MTKRLVQEVRERAPALLSRRPFLVLVMPAFAVVYFVGAMSIDSPPVHLQVSARAFPMLVGAALIVSTLVIVLQEWRAGEPTEPSVAPDEEIQDLEELEAEGESTVGSWRDFWLTFAALVALVVLLDDIGFVIAATALVAGLSIYIERRHVARNLAFSLAYVLILYYLFDSVFKIALPTGPLPF